MRLTSADGAFVELRIAGYQFADGISPTREWDTNWLFIEGAVHTGDGTSWSFRHPSLTTWEAAELAEWLEQAASGAVPVATHGAGRGVDARAGAVAGLDVLDQLPEAGWLTFTEPNLSVAVADDHGDEIRLVVGLAAESAPPPIDPLRPRWHPVTLVTGAGHLRVAAAALQAGLDSYPAR